MLLCTSNICFCFLFYVIDGTEGKQVSCFNILSQMLCFLRLFLFFFGLINILIIFTQTLQNNFAFLFMVLYPGRRPDVIGLFLSIRCNEIVSKCTRTFMIDQTWPSKHHKWLSWSLNPKSFAHKSSQPSLQIGQFFEISFINLQLTAFVPLFLQFSNPETPGYVGFANLPNQVHRKSVKKGFEFTLMVVGKYILCYLID